MAERFATSTPYQNSCGSVFLFIVSLADKPLAASKNALRLPPRKCKLGSESAFAACDPNVRYTGRPQPSNMNWRLAAEPIRLRRFRSASNHGSRFPAAVRQSDPAGFPAPAGARVRPTSPHARLSSSDTPNQQCCTHRPRSDWRSRRPHLCHRSLFTDFLHFGSSFAA